MTLTGLGKTPTEALAMGRCEEPVGICAHCGGQEEVIVAAVIST